MPATPNAFERYQPYRRFAEAGFWIAVFLLQAGFNSLTALDDLARAGLRYPPWQPVAWELSSNLVLLALVPALVAFERRFPLRWDALARHLPLHLAASLPGPERAHGLATVGLLEEAPVEGLDPPHGGHILLPKGPGLGVRLRERTP